MESAWTTVYCGSFSDVLVLQAALGAQGFQTMIAHQNMKTIAPFFTGIQAFDVRLETPTESAPDVVAAISELRASPTDASAPAAELPAVQRELLDKSGKIMRWSYALFSPLAVVLGLRYLRDVARLGGERPDGYGLTLVTFWIAVYDTVWFLLALTLGFVGWWQFVTG